MHSVFSFLSTSNDYIISRNDTERHNIYKQCEIKIILLLLCILFDSIETSKARVLKQKKNIQMHKVPNPIMGIIYYFNY